MAALLVPLKIKVFIDTAQFTKQAGTFENLVSGGSLACSSTLRLGALPENPNA